MATINIDPYTSAVTPIDMYFNETYLSRGTGFFWKAGDEIYLVTNWHNFSGKNPFTGEHISETAGEPNRIEFDIFEGGDLNKRNTESMDLYNNDIPTWLEHPKFKNKVDVVCKKVDLDSRDVYPINTLSTSKIITRVAHDVFILGFPMGIDTHRFPLWKRGSVASEPDIDAKNLPMFYVDTATSKGMSGSPVIQRATGGEIEGRGSAFFMSQPQTRFIGIYSGRITPEEKHEAQLGIVWKVHVIDEIIKGAAG